MLAILIEVEIDTVLGIGPIVHADMQVQCDKECCLSSNDTDFSVGPCAL
jgi:hypothetical protein